MILITLFQIFNTIVSDGINLNSLAPSSLTISRSVSGLDHFEMPINFFINRTDARAVCAEFKFLLKSDYFYEFIVFIMSFKFIFTSFLNH
jgi:hypothetical protein